MSDKFGVILVDPPWPYARAREHAKLTGYANYEYQPMSIGRLRDLPVEAVAGESCVLLLWCVWPFLLEAREIIDHWGFEYKTGFPWVKITGVEDDLTFKPEYGVGYWFRGATEPVLVASRGHASKNVRRTNLVGLLSRNAKHSRKPETIYDVAEKFPGPYLEVFARETRLGWTSLGNEVQRGLDIHSAMNELL